MGLTQKTIKTIMKKIAIFSCFFCKNLGGREAESKHSFTK